MSRFAVYPALDLRGGRCVRLQQGAAEHETVYDLDPRRVVERFAADGAAWVHVVDLDAAFGEGENRELIGELAAAAGPQLQVGGGLRDDEALERVLQLGVRRVVIGTAAVVDPSFVERALHRWGAERIAVGLDARGEHLALRGWREQSSVGLFAAARELVERGVRTLIYTDIERDGMLHGPNLTRAAELAERTIAEVIVAGGFGTLAQVAAAREAGLGGAILGKALYEGRFTLAEALRVAAG